MSERSNHLPPFEYKILSDPDMREKYTANTLELVNFIREQEIDSTVFLDKSARPAAHLLRDIWTEYYGTREGLPSTHFINLDFRDWPEAYGKRGVRRIDAEEIPHEELQNLRATYSKPGLSPDNDKETLFDDKRVAIIDECLLTGNTLESAHDILERAFPKASFVPYAWDESGNAPAWFSVVQKTGRLVGDVDPERSAQSSSERQRRGQRFLSAPFHADDYGEKGMRGLDKQGRDTRGIQLKREIAWLAHELSAADRSI